MKILVQEVLRFYDNGDYFFLGADVTNSTTIKFHFQMQVLEQQVRFPIRIISTGGDEIMRVKSTTVSGSGHNELTVIRGALEQYNKIILQVILVKKIKPIPIEFRDHLLFVHLVIHLNILDSNPGNYSTALPQVQVRTLQKVKSS